MFKIPESLESSMDERVNCSAFMRSSPSILIREERGTVPTNLLQNVVSPPLISRRFSKISWCRSRLLRVPATKTFGPVRYSVIPCAMVPAIRWFGKQGNGLVLSRPLAWYPFSTTTILERPRLGITRFPPRSSPLQDAPYLPPNRYAQTCVRCKCEFLLFLSFPFVGRTWLLGGRGVLSCCPFLRSTDIFAEEEEERKRRRRRRSRRWRGRRKSCCDAARRKSEKEGLGRTMAERKGRGEGAGEEQQRSAEGRGCTRAEVTFNVSRHAAQGTVSLASSSLLIWRQFPGNLPSKN